MTYADVLEHVQEQQKEAAAARGKALAQDLFDTALAMNRAAAVMYAPKPCDHCRGTGTVPDWGNDGKPKHCPMCNGTGGPRVTKMAYNIHRG